MSKVEEGAVVLESYWLDRVQARESTSPEGNELCVICCTSFRVHNQRCGKPLLTQLLPVLDILNDFLSFNSSACAVDEV